MTTMQRRHFELIAAQIKTADMTEPARSKMAENFGNILSGTNPQFNRDRFVTAYLSGKMGNGRSHKDVS